MKARISLTMILIVVALTTLAMAASASTPAINEYVYLDPSFGAGGKVLTQINGSHQNYANALVLQPDGKLVVAGYTQSADGYNDFALARYNPDGSLDDTFGSGGVVSTDFTGGDDRAYALALQNDGKLVAAGCAAVETRGYSIIAVVRYNPDGSLDESWGDSNPLYGEGRVTTQIEYSSVVHAVAIQPDGKIVIAGNDMGQSAPTQGVLVRYNPDGSLDTSFNSTGKIDSYYNLPFEAVLVQPDGKLVTGGDAIGRFNPDGSIDETWPSISFPIPPDWPSYIRALALQPDGKVVAIGRYLDVIKVTRLNSDGSLDESFGSGGITSIKISPRGGYDLPSAVAIQPDGKIIVAEAIYLNSQNGTLYDPGGLAVARFNPDGSLDTRFNAVGYVTTRFNGDSGNTYNTAKGVVIQPDGNIVVAGTVDALDTSGNTIHQFALARYKTQSLGFDLSVDSQLPDPGQLITYTLQLSNQGPLTLTNVRLTDELPGEVALAGQIHLEPANAGVVGSLPELASGIDLDIGQAITITLPVEVDPELVNVATITNTVSMTSTEIPQPLMTSVIIQNNAAPIARDDFALVEKNTDARLFPLGNDSDPNGQTISLTEVSTPQHGAAVIDGSTVLYTPEADFTGRDEFTYTVSDGSLSATATVTVDVLDKVWHSYFPIIPSSAR
jgi:uncharacterized delta-60 repeat protein/uncharacterized repeat protein (TIGR01451 family)